MTEPRASHPRPDPETTAAENRAADARAAENRPILLVAVVCLLMTFVAAFVSAPGAETAPAQPPVLATLGFDAAGQLAWNGLTAGMTRREAERVVGRRLQPVAPVVDRCGEREAAARVAGLDAVLVFAGPGQDAPLRAVSIPGRSATPSAVEARFPGMEKVVAGPRPIYRTAADELLVVEPGARIDFGQVCLD